MTWRFKVITGGQVTQDRKIPAGGKQHQQSEDQQGNHNQHQRDVDAQPQRALHGCHAIKIALSLKFLHPFFKQLPAFLEIAKLIKTGAAGREQDDIARLDNSRRGLDGFMQPATLATVKGRWPGRWSPMAARILPAASPKTTRWSTRSWTRLARSSQGRFLSRPPRSSTSGSLNERMAAIVRSGAVAIESLYQSPRPRCGSIPAGGLRPENLRPRPAWHSAGSPAAWAMAQAARTLLRLCSPAQEDGFERHYGCAGPLAGLQVQGTAFNEGS